MLERSADHKRVNDILPVPKDRARGEHLSRDLGHWAWSMIRRGMTVSE